MRSYKSAVTILCPLSIVSSWAGKPKPDRLIMLRGNQVSVVLGPSHERHDMKSLAQFGAPAEYVNRDLERLILNEGLCIYVAGPATSAPPAAFGVVIECFDLVAEKETKALAYTADSEGQLVTDGKLTPTGEYGKEDAHFDLAAWQWVMEHVSSALKQKIALHRAQGTPAMPENVYKVNAAGKDGGPK